MGSVTAEQKLVESADRSREHLCSLLGSLPGAAGGSQGAAAGRDPGRWPQGQGGQWWPTGCPGPTLRFPLEVCTGASPLPSGWREKGRALIMRRGLCQTLCPDGEPFPAVESADTTGSFRERC